MALVTFVKEMNPERLLPCCNYTWKLAQPWPLPAFWSVLLRWCDLVAAQGECGVNICRLRGGSVCQSVVLTADVGRPSQLWAVIPGQAVYLSTDQCTVSLHVS